MRFAARPAALAVATTLALGGGVLTAAPSQAATTHDPVGVRTAASWIAGVAAANPTGMLQSGYDNAGTWTTYDDQGLTIDAVESLVEAGQQPAAVQAMTSAVEKTASDYASYGPGQAAKLLVLAQDAGRPLATFGPGNLASQVESEVATGADAGALQNAYGSVLSQAYAARALAATGSAKASDVLGYLLRQQCSAGFFRADYSSGGGCVDGTSTGSTDATALAVIELSHVTATPAVTTALGKARTWLASQQQSDGSWSAFGAGNANATGLAARAVTDTAAREKAAAWLFDHQAREGGPATLTKDLGAIALDDNAYQDGVDYGLDERSTTTWARATAQALPALASLTTTKTGVTGPLTLTGPTGYRKAGSTVTLSVSGTRAGQVLELTGPGVAVRGTAAGATWSRTVTLPAGTGTRTFKVADLHGRSSQRSVAVLGTTTLSVSRSAYRLHRSRLVTVTVRGLASREPAAVSYRGHVVKRTTASTSGVVKATFRVGRTLGVQKVLATGAFSDVRRGTTTIRVVR